CWSPRGRPSRGSRRFTRSRRRAARTGDTRGRSGQTPGWTSPPHWSESCARWRATAPRSASRHTRGRSRRCASARRPGAATAASRPPRCSPPCAARRATALPRSDDAPPVAKRVFDIVVASLTLLAALPVLAVAALAIRLASPGPVLHRAARAGRDGRPFTMLKLRTMHVAPPGESGSRITDPADPRVFPVGALLRRTKIDELPQLVNVLRGEMAIVGPRPEDPEIVRKHYSPTHRETLRVRPGLVSPGSIYHFTHGDALLGAGDPETAYAARLLPVTLELER